MSIIATIYTREGGAKHVTALTTAQFDYAPHLAYIFMIYQPFALICLTTGKISVMCLIKRLQSPTRWRTVMIWTLGILLAAYNFVNIVLLFVQCNDLLADWDPSASPAGNCLPGGAGSINALAGAST